MSFSGALNSLLVLIVSFFFCFFSLVQENERKIILRLVGRGKMLQCPLGREVMLLRQSGEREGHYTVLRGRAYFLQETKIEGIFDSQKIDISIFRRFQFLLIRSRCDLNFTLISLKIHVKSWTSPSKLFIY